MKLNHRKIIFWLPFYLLLLLPVVLFCWWYFSSTTPLKVVLFDKTVYNNKMLEHDAFNWVLTQNNIVKPDGELYDKEKDYYGFFPESKDSFSIKDIEGFSKLEIDSLAEELDLLVFTDTYGVYSNEWNEKKDVNERSKLIYGKTTFNEALLLESAKKKGKDIICEFNLIASPTSHRERKKIEELFDFKWSGWVGRYYDNLDTNINGDLPMWLKKNYVEQHNMQWPFTDAGIVLVHENERVEILGTEEYLLNEDITVTTSKKFQDSYNLPELTKYNFWFDITSDLGDNELISTYTINTSPKGDSVLNNCGIKKSFPAVFRSQDSSFHYLAGDFSDHTLDNFTRYFRGVYVFNSLFVDKFDKSARNYFFWEYYRPLIESILDRVIKK